MEKEATERSKLIQEILSQANDIDLLIEGGNPQRPDLVLIYVKDEVQYLYDLVNKLVEMENSNGDTPSDQK